MVEKNTVLLVSTVNRFDLLERFLLSVSNQTVIPKHVIIVDNSGGKLDQSRLKRFNFQKLKVVTANNIGVAASWNIGLETDNENLIVSNDDRMLMPTALESMIELMDKHPEHVMFSGQNANFSFFGTHQKLAVEKIGLFDEAFYPAYYEDVDYYHRMRLEGQDWRIPKKKICDEALTQSVAKNKQASMELIECIHAGQVSNHCRYVQKWGGVPGGETFVTPFNLNKFDVS